VDAIWFGPNEAYPKVLASQYPHLDHQEPPYKGTGWVPYPIPEDVLLNTQMHLTQDQVKALLPILQYFAEHGDLPDDVSYRRPEESK